MSRVLVGNVSRPEPQRFVLLRTEVSVGSWSGKGSNIHSINLSVALELFAVTGRKRSIDKVLGNVSGFLTWAIFLALELESTRCPSMHQVCRFYGIIYRTFPDYLVISRSSIQWTQWRWYSPNANSHANLRQAPLKHSRQIRQRWMGSCWKPCVLLYNWGKAW